MNRLFESAAEKQDYENERQAQQNRTPLANTTSGADARGQPDAGCSGQSMYMAILGVSDYDACAQKSDSSHDTLDNAACVGTAVLADVDNHQCSAEPD